MRSVELPKIETVENKYPDRRYVVECTFPEFTTICPKTGLPDFGTIRILYEPDQRIMELRSLKLYLVGFRNIGFFHEHFTNRILDDVVESVNPRWIYVEARINNRGGIYTSVSRYWDREGADDIKRALELMRSRQTNPSTPEYE